MSSSSKASGSQKPVVNDSDIDTHRLDLSGQSLSKLMKQPWPEFCRTTTSLLLDNNDLRKLEHLEKFVSLVELSASHNQIVRMYPVCRLQHLVRLDLSHNSILLIEGLKDLIHLKYLNLSCNKIKTIERLQSNLLLEHLDLSENLITGIANISDLTKLQKLFLHKNKIVQLRHGEVYLPKSVETLTLAGNQITDLAEFSHLVNLLNIVELSLVNNPCVDMTGRSVGFDYRPYILNWCLNIRLIDGFLVDDIERLKAEWLYSQGRGRKFKPGQHNELVQYLVETCPLNSQSLMAENERKLRLILSKAHHHQKQLKLAEQTGPSEKFAGVMSRSLDPSVLSCASLQEDSTGIQIDKIDSLTRSLCEPVRAVAVETISEEVQPITGRAPLPAATKLVPVPESLVSPLIPNPPPLPLSLQNGISQDEVAAEKLSTIKHLAQQKIEQKFDSDHREQAALCIQKMWRGYRVRHLNPGVSSMYQHLQMKRTHQYIQKLSEDMDATRKTLENDHKLQVLQMQAINALWKKVQELQSCMQEVLRCVSSNGNTVVSTQTEIVAVHSPLSEQDNFLSQQLSSVSLNDDCSRPISSNNDSVNKVPSMRNTEQTSKSSGIDNIQSEVEPPNSSVTSNS